MSLSDFIQTAIDPHQMLVNESRQSIEQYFVIAKVTLYHILTFQVFVKVTNKSNSDGRVSKGDTWEVIFAEYQMNVA